MATPYHYQAFGLIFRSDIEIPEFSEDTGLDPTDVTIAIGPIDPRCFVGMSPRDYWKATPDYFVMEVPKLARYHISEGKRITVEPTKAANLDSLRLFLLGSCLGVLFHQRGLVPIHGSAIVSSWGAIIFSGPIGAGKSSLATAFFQKGYRLLADDIALLKLVPGRQIEVVPSFPQIKLSENTARLLGMATDGLVRVDPESSKFKLPIHRQFSTSAEPLAKIFFIEPSSTATFEIDTPSGMNKFSLLGQNVYRQSLIADLGKSKDHFGQLSRISQEVAIQIVKRPLTGLDPAALAHRLIPYFGNNR